MRIIRHFTTVADVIAQGPEYVALYRLLLEIYSRGLNPEMRFLESDFPSVTLCNCAKTILDELHTADDLAPFLDSYHRRLKPTRKFRNPRTETITRQTYDCHPHTGAQRCAVIAAVLYLAEASGALNEDQLRQYKDWILLHADDYLFADTFIASIPPLRQLKEPMPPTPRMMLTNYAIAHSVLESVDRALESKPAAERPRFLDALIQTFLGERESLRDILGGILTARYDVLVAETKAEQAGDDAGNTHAIPSGQGGTTRQATGRQIGILFYYLFNELGIDFTNSDKSAWARLLSFITGYSEETLRKKLDFDFENKQVQKDLGTVKAEIQELFPAIARKIDNDKKI
ncbi:MAG: hypothetical protein IJ636_01085 [Bacteroidales bacterium]|nr:hypothetical protein [Bacteroidales bacterium]